MPPDHRTRGAWRRGIALAVFSITTATLVVALVGLVPRPSGAAGEATVGLGTATTYSVLGGQTVTNSGPTILSGDLGVSPGSAITGFPPGIALGVVHAGDDEAAAAQADLTIAYDDAASRAPTALLTGQDLGGLTLVGGVYTFTGSAALTGTLTLDGQGNPDAVFIFQIASELLTATSSTVSLTNNADACNVFWQVGSSATLGSGSTFVGTIMALTSISVGTGAIVEGRALARNGQVSLLSNVFTEAGCDSTTTTTTAGDGGSTSSTSSTSTPASTTSTSTPASSTSTSTSTPTSTTVTSTSTPASTSSTSRPTSTTTLRLTTTSTDQAVLSSESTTTTAAAVVRAAGADRPRGEIPRTGAGSTVNLLVAAFLLFLLGVLLLSGPRLRARRALLSKRS